MWPLTPGANALTTSRTAEGKTLTPHLALWSCASGWRCRLAGQVQSEATREGGHEGGRCSRLAAGVLR